MADEEQMQYKVQNPVIFTISGRKKLGREWPIFVILFELKIFRLDEIIGPGEKIFVLI
jgi:hypothetical protein